MTKWDTVYEWAEPLPDECPPDDAVPPEGEVYYRMVESFPPTETDFVSHRELYPNKHFSLGECQVRSCSVFTDHSRCADLTKLPRHKDKMVVEFQLDRSSGVVLRTGTRQGHYSWWRSRNFDPIPLCSLADSQGKQT